MVDTLSREEKMVCRQISDYFKSRPGLLGEFTKRYYPKGVPTKKWIEAVIYRDKEDKRFFIWNNAVKFYNDCLKKDEELKQNVKRLANKSSAA